MVVSQLRDRAPNYLPDGYRLSHITPGTAVRQLGDDPDQLTFTYQRTFDVAEVPLRVTIATGRGRVLKATEQRSGVRIALDGTGSVAMYHDGSWAPGTGADQVELAGQYVIHWDRVRFHSLTVATEADSIAVLAPTDLAIDELVKIASSIATQAHS